MAAFKESDRNQEVEDVKKFMSDVAGRRFLYRLLSKSGLYQSVFRERPLLRQQDWPIFNGAQRDFGQWVMDELVACAPIDYDRMIGEERELKLLERMAAHDMARKCGGCGNPFTVTRNGATTTVICETCTPSGNA